MLAACGSGSTGGSGEISTAGSDAAAVVSEGTGAGADAATSKDDATGTGQAEKKENTSDTGDVDLDLTKLSATVVYSEVYNIMTEPDDYLGKKIRMEGTVSIYHDENSGKDYYACIIRDAAACCAQGIEFDLADTYKYPGDYISEGVDVTVEGIFSSYTEGEEGEYIYYTLRDAELV